VKLEQLLPVDVHHVDVAARLQELSMLCNEVGYLLGYTMKLKMFVPGRTVRLSFYIMNSGRTVRLSFYIMNSVS